MTDPHTKRILGLPANIFLLGVVSFFNDLSSEMILAVLPAFFIAVLHTGAISLGLVEGVADGAANLIKIYAGNLSDRIQKRKMFITAGYLLSVATRPFYVFASTVGGVVGLRLLDRTGKGLREGPRDAIISLSSPKAELGRSFGYHRTMDTLGAITGPLIAYLILRHFPQGFHVVFMTAFITGLFAVTATLFVSDVVGKIKGKKLSLASLALFSRDFKIYLCALFFLAAGSLPVAVMLLQTAHLGAALASIPLFYALYNSSYAAFSIVGGKWSDRIGARRVIGVGYLLLIMSYAVIALAPSLRVLASGFLLLGLFPALTDGVLRAHAATLTPEEDRGGAYGLVNAVLGFGAIIAGIGGGYLWQTFSAAVAFGVGALIVLCGLILLYFSHRSVSI